MYGVGKEESGGLLGSGFSSWGHETSFMEAGEQGGGTDSGGEGMAGSAWVGPAGLERPVGCPARRLSSMGLELGREN